MKYELRVKSVRTYTCKLISQILPDPAICLYEVVKIFVTIQSPYQKTSKKPYTKQEKYGIMELMKNLPQEHYTPIQLKLPVEIEKKSKFLIRYTVFVRCLVMLT